MGSPHEWNKLLLPHITPFEPRHVQQHSSLKKTKKEYKKEILTIKQTLCNAAVMSRVNSYALKRGKMHVFQLQQIIAKSWFARLFMLLSSVTKNCSSNFHFLSLSTYVLWMCETMFVSVCLRVGADYLYLCCLSVARAKFCSPHSSLPFLVKMFPSSSYSLSVTLWLVQVYSVTNQAQLCDLNVKGWLA